jgi:hypothetical protein
MSLDNNHKPYMDTDLNHNYAKLLEVESKTERGRIKKIFLFDEWELREE